ncbi:MAG: cupin domain-containing protein [Acidobacteria bacterium]|nr:cupin domain-containing protein [Acidobacteriota bacterium]
MNTDLRRVRWLLCGVSVYVLSAAAYGQDRAAIPTFVSRQPEELKSADGVTAVVIMGDPSKPGMYVVQNTFAPGRTSRPHFHDQDRYITVIKGTWWVSLGPEADVYNPSKMVAMKAGSFVFHPAGGHHYDGAKDEEAVVRIMGMGPVKTTQLEAR